MFGRSCPVEPCLVSDVRCVRRRRVSRNLVSEPERRDNGVRRVRRRRMSCNLVCEPDGCDSGPKVMFDDVMHDKLEYSLLRTLVQPIKAAGSGFIMISTGIAFHGRSVANCFRGHLPSMQGPNRHSRWIRLHRCGPLHL